MEAKCWGSNKCPLNSEFFCMLCKIWRRMETTVYRPHYSWYGHLEFPFCLFKYKDLPNYNSPLAFLTFSLRRKAGVRLPSIYSRLELCSSNAGYNGPIQRRVHSPTLLFWERLLWGFWWRNDQSRCFSYTPLNYERFPGSPSITYHILNCCNHPNPSPNVRYAAQNLCPASNISLLTPEEITFSPD